MKCKEINKFLLLLLLINFCLTNETIGSTASIEQTPSNDQDISPDLISQIYKEFEKESDNQTPNTELVALEKSAKKKGKNAKKGAKGRKAGKGKKSKPLPKYKVVKTPNSLLKKIKPKALKKAVFYKKCVIKTGFVNIVQKRPKPPSNLVIKVMPIFLKIANGNFTLYQTPSSKKPLSSISLVNILRIDQHYYNTNCFDVITTTVTKNKKQLKQGILTLCTDNFALKQDWVLKILEFKQCKLSGEHNLDQNKLILMDFNKMNIVQRKHNIKNYNLGHLYYDARDRAFKRKDSLKHFRKISRIKKAFEMITKNIERGNLAAQQVRRKFVSRLKKARSFSEGVSQRTSLLKRRYEMKMMKEREMESSKLKLIHKKKEVRMIHKAMSKIQEFKEDEVKSLKHSFENQIKMEKNRAQNEAKNIMRIIADEGKLTDYRVCFSNNVKAFKDRKFIGSLCKRYYGDHGRNTCETKSSFCQMCCEFHIGINYPGKRLSCRRNCGKIIKNKPLHKKKGKKGKKGGKGKEKGNGKKGNKKNKKNSKNVKKGKKNNL